MRLKRLILTFASLLIISTVFFAGYITGKNRTIKQELNVSIPVNVLIYRTIKQGDGDRAATLMSMVLLGKIERYDSLKNDWLYRVAGGGGLTHSSRLRESVAEGRIIAAEEKTNLVTIMPPQKNGPEPKNGVLHKR